MWKKAVIIPTLFIVGALMVLTGSLLSSDAHAPETSVLAATSPTLFPANPTKTWAFDDLNGINIARDTQEVYNDEAQLYTYRKKNVRIENGKLVIGAFREDYKDHQYTSGWVDTDGRFSAEYGKFEAVMKLPKGKGTWPAFWLLSDNNIHTAKTKPTVIEWLQPRFYMKDGEIDIMEHYGSNQNVIEGTFHTYNRSIEKAIRISDASQFHTYGVEITPNKLTWTVDGTPYQTIAKTSSNSDDWPVGNGNKYFFIINLALGGDGGGSITVPPSKSWRMEVDRVSYYPYIGASTQ